MKTTLVSQSGKKIVLTGGPGAGKTVITTTLARQYPARFTAVPESASETYAQLNTRWDKLDNASRRNVQRRIYRHQLELESAAALKCPMLTLLLDRGTVDGATYWPDGPEAYWQDIGATLPDELNRYHGVIWMQTSAALGLYDGQSTNPHRHEDAAAAIAAGQKLIDLWQQHPRFTMVPAFENFDDKLEAVRGEIERMLAKNMVHEKAHR